MQKKTQSVTDHTPDVSFDVLNLDLFRELTIDEMKSVTGGGWNAWISRSHPLDNLLDREV